MLFAPKNKKDKLISSIFGTFGKPNSACRFVIIELGADNYYKKIFYFNE